MRWILDQCIDQYGLCIRQYVYAGLGLLIGGLSAWSCYKTSSKHRQITFQQIPLIINFLTTLLIFSLQISTEQYFNTHLIFMFIELYSYYLLTYALIFLYYKAERVSKSKIMKKLNLAFIIGSIVIFLAAILVTVLTFIDVIKCTEQYWISNVVLLFLQIPIYVATVIYSAKTKQKVKKMSQKYEKPVESLHLLKQEDSYVRLKILQTNLVWVTFTISILLHISQAILQNFMENKSICLKETNKIQVRNEIQLLIMIISNLGEIFPHLMIPLIFWLIPDNINKKAPKSLYVSIPNIKINPKLITTKIDSNFRIDQGDQQIHRKLMS